MEVLDFKTAERVVTSMDAARRVIGTWMSCGRSPHDIAFIKGPNGQAAPLRLPPGRLELDPARGRHLLRCTTCRSTSAPTRHGITRGTTIYFFDPAGNRNEVFAGLGYRVQHDFPTINWTVDQLAKGIFYHARELNDVFTSVFT